MIGVGDHRKHKESTEAHLTTPWYDQYHGVGTFCLQILWHTDGQKADPSTYAC